MRTAGRTSLGREPRQVVNAQLLPKGGDLRRCLREPFLSEEAMFLAPCTRIGAAAIPPVHSGSRSKVIPEPSASQPRDRLERAGLLEQMRGTGDDLQLLLAAESVERLAVQGNDLDVGA